MADDSDSPVDKSFCSYCQKSFKSAKAYNNHARGMVHITLYNEAKAAKANEKGTEINTERLDHLRHDEPIQKQPRFIDRTIRGENERNFEQGREGQRPRNEPQFRSKLTQPRNRKRSVLCDNETIFRVERHWKPRQNQQWRKNRVESSSSKGAIGDDEDDSDSSGHEDRTFCKYCQRSFTHFSAYYNHARGMVHLNLKREAKAAKKAAQQSYTEVHTETSNASQLCNTADTHACDSPSNDGLQTVNSEITRQDKVQGI